MALDRPAVVAWSSTHQSARDHGCPGLGAHRLLLARFSGGVLRRARSRWPVVRWSGRGGALRSGGVRRRRSRRRVRLHERSDRLRRLPETAATASGGYNVLCSPRLSGTVAVRRPGWRHHRRDHELGALRRCVGGCAGFGEHDRLAGRVVSNCDRPSLFDRRERVGETWPVEGTGVEVVGDQLVGRAEQGSPA